MIPYCQQSAEEREDREITSEKGARKSCLRGLSSLAENMVIWDFILAILSLAHSLPKTHSRLWKKMHTTRREKQHLVVLGSMYCQRTATLETGRGPAAAPAAGLW